MQYDARPKEANDESALLTTSSMQISGAIVIIMGNGNMRTVSTMPCLSSSSCHLQIKLRMMYILCSGFLTFIKYINYLLNSW